MFKVSRIISDLHRHSLEKEEKKAMICMFYPNPETFLYIYVKLMRFILILSLKMQLKKLCYSTRTIPEPYSTLFILNNDEYKILESK